MSGAVTGHTVPYVAMWSGEQMVPGNVVVSPWGGVGFEDETARDRDMDGLLWRRYESRPGCGKPVFGDVHARRQRRVMRLLLCQVCADQPDRNADGVLWVMADYRDDWPGWPDRMATNDGPVCIPCARTTARLCSGLRGRLVLIRSKTHPIVGVRGVRYLPTLNGSLVTNAELVDVAFNDLLIRWTIAHQLLRQLRDCVIIGTDVNRL